MSAKGICSCKIIFHKIHRCPMHNAAPGMLATLRQVQSYFYGKATVSVSLAVCEAKLSMDIDAAIAKAEGRE